MTRAQAHLMLAECDLLDALEANEKKEKNNYTKKKRAFGRGGIPDAASQPGHEPAGS